MQYSEFLRPMQAGLLYFGGVFALGFMFGAIRLMLLVPAVGEVNAVLIELPVLLGFSWIFCQRALNRFEVVNRFRARTVMGLTAFSVLMIMEFLLGVVLFGNGTTEYFLRFQTLAGALGLTGQILFALLPVIQMAKDPHNSGTPR